MEFPQCMSFAHKLQARMTTWCWCAARSAYTCPTSGFDLLSRFHDFLSWPSGVALHACHNWLQVDEIVAFITEVFDAFVPM